jgi:membrane protease YdiL (CAAX protease family)
MPELLSHLGNFFQWSASLDHGPMLVLVWLGLWFFAYSLRVFAGGLNRPGWRRLTIYLVDPMSKWVLFLFGLSIYIIGYALPQGEGLSQTLYRLHLTSHIGADTLITVSVVLLFVWLGVAVGINALALRLGAKPAQYSHLLQPRTPAETAAFMLVLSPTAGILEETIFRGFLLTLFASWYSDVWQGALLSSILFGLMHSYQGPLGIVATGFMGWIAAATVIFTGSLWPAIIAHTLYDMGTVIIYRRLPDPPGGPLLQ